MCEKLHCLPNPGGLFQQDQTHVKKMQRVFSAIEQYRSDHDPSKIEESKQRALQKATRLES